MFEKNRKGTDKCEDLNVLSIGVYDQKGYGKIFLKKKKLSTPPPLDPSTCKNVHQGRIFLF